METMIAYFNQIPSTHRALILAGGITIFWMIEGLVPLVKFTYNKWQHAAANLFFTVTTVVVNFGFATAIIATSEYCISNSIGLQFLLPMPTWLMALLGLLVLDFVGAYLVHWVQHKIPFMWRFHMVHHADTYVDTTTANRHHPGESVFRAAFTLVAVFLYGAPIWLVMLYQSASALLSQFNHANIYLPPWLDRLISLAIVSPNMHKVHHHFVQPQTDTNYGNIFSIWDRLLGTFNYTPTSNIVYGLDVLQHANTNNIASQLKMPFDQKNVRKK